MSYQKYLEEGVILKMEEWGESGRVLKILTRHGIKNLVATGVRELGSKMRGEMEVLSRVDFEYVEGKAVGRLVGIFPKEKLFENYLLENFVQIRNSISNVVNFVLRVVVGELDNEKLYENFLEGLRQIQTNERELVQQVEIVWLIKILVSLGYWEENLNDKFDSENLKYISEHKKEMIDKINTSIESSHL